MRVRAVFEGESKSVELIAEGKEEQYMLGILGNQVTARVHVRHDGHESYGRISSVTVVLSPTPPAEPESPAYVFDEPK